MTMKERSKFTSDAIDQDDCVDARDGLRAVERLRTMMAPATSLRARVDQVCAATGDP